MTLLLILLGGAFTLAAAYALGVILLRKTPAPPEIALGLGAAAASALVFASLLVNAGYREAFVAAGLAVIAALKWVKPTPLADPVHAPLGRARWALFTLLAAYGAWYFVNAVAPEVAADGVTYHLGLPAEYLRLAGFPDRVSFFGVAPQGMEMLYTVAFSIGRHSAAKLVEFGFLMATPPLFLRIGRRLGMSDLAALTAAALYFCAPVTGITGSSSYTDAAGVFFALAAFYLLLVWRDADEWRYLTLAGVLAGFCYAIKFPGAFAAAGAIAFPLFASRAATRARRLRQAALVAGAAALVMVPWVARAYWLTGNPFAPLLNGLFPNPHFHLATERELAASLRSLGETTPWTAPWELAFGDHLTGTFGPLLFALPLGLLAVRRPSARLCLAAAAALAVPWYFNTGARFLMPAFAFAALALVMALPRALVWAALVIQAVLCWPHVIDLWETRFAFRLHEFPLRAAARLTPEADYIGKREHQYAVARLIEELTPPDARILALLPVANAYLDRDVTVTWQSAEGDRMLDTLRIAALGQGGNLFERRVSWPAAGFRALRLRSPHARSGEWELNELRLYSGQDQIYNSPQWTLDAWPNPWELPLAFDGNAATRWRSWEPARAGMYVEIDFDRAQRLSGAAMLTPLGPNDAPVEIFGRQASGGDWIRLSGASEEVTRKPHDLRLEAARALRAAGFRWILSATGSGGNAPIGNILAEHAPQWGLEVAGNAGRFILFHVK